MKTLIVIPTYNEKENIEKIIIKINEVLKNYDFSILIVDDSSPDGTSEIVENLKRKHNNLLLLKRTGRLGLGTAYIEGFKFGLEKGFDYFIEMDADFSHNPEYLPKIIDNFSNYDVVIGSRNIKGGNVPDWSISRNLISKLGSLYSKLILSCPINDLTGGFNGWKREILEKINLDSIISIGFSFQIEMKYKAFKNNAKILEIPIIFYDRKFGKSKMSKKIFFEALLNVIKIRIRS